MNKYTLSLLFLTLIACGGCNLNPSPNSYGQDIYFPTNTTDTLVYVKSEKILIPVVVSIPECVSQPSPAVIVMHGSGGMWKDNIAGGELSTQMAAWKELFDSECIISVFIDSYSPRGVVENSGPYKDPPKTFEISPQFVRPKDAYDVLQYLWTIKNEGGENFLVRKSKVGLMGFSHGATAVESAMFDPALVPPDWEWTQKINGTTYDVFPPYLPQSPLAFAAAVAYYPGSFHDGYFGNICDNSESVYQNYSPLLMHLGGADPLTSNSICFFASANLNGGHVEYIFYEKAEHSFDEKEDDINASASLAAKNATLQWFKKYLEF